MKVVSSESQDNTGISLEHSGNKITIREALLALEQAHLAGNREDICSASIQLAHLHFRQGRYDQTRLLTAEVLRDAPSDSLRRCDALRMLGNCAAELGDPDAAEEYYHQAIDLARQLDYHYALYICLHSLATNIYWPRGQFELCLAAGKEALAQAQSLDLGEELWFPLSDIAWVYWTTGQRAHANQIADQMQAVVSPGSLGDGFFCCLRAGLAEPGEDYLDTILPLYEHARSIAEATGDPGLNVEVRLGLCRAYRAVKDLPVSLVWAEDAVAVSLRMNYRQFQGATLIERARTLMDQGSLDIAETDLRCALDIALRLRSNFDLARAILYLATILSAQNRPEASSAWQRAVRLISDSGYDFLVGQERVLALPWIAHTLNAPDPILAETSAALFDRLLHLPPDPLQVQTFGQVALQVGSDQVPKESLRRRRSGELLVLLLSKPSHTLSAGQISEAMCPEKDPDAALDFYHHAISALRRLLEPDLPDRRFPCRYLELDGEHVRLLLPAGSTIDFLEFETAVRHKDWQKAVELYTGEFAPSWRYAEWTIPIRQHLSDQYEFALLTLAESRLRQGDSTACLGLSRQASLHNPWQERAVELGMRAAMELGDRMAALQMYRRLEKVLAKELGIAPLKELQQLYTAVKARSVN